MADYSTHAIDVKLSDLPSAPKPKGLLSSFLSSNDATEEKGEDEEEWSKHTTLFKEWSKLDTKKTM